MNFNPIIVLFLTGLSLKTAYELKFQSYYSLISNANSHNKSYTIVYNFNPIIVLFLTDVFVFHVLDYCISILL